MKKFASLSAAGQLLSKGRFHFLMSPMILALRSLPALMLMVGLLVASPARPKKQHSFDWQRHGGDAAGNQYSPLAQINTKNVRKLNVAWTYHSGGKRDDNRSQIQCNPIVVNGVLYGTSAQLEVFALDAATGRRIWAFDAFSGSAGQELSKRESRSCLLGRFRR